MRTKKILGYGLFVTAILTAGYFGARLFLERINTSVVFYAPGKILSLKTEATTPPSYPHLPDNQIKNIILFVGDGMGLSHLTAARVHWLGADGRLHIERMPVTGLATTHAVDNLITDSAAAGTALATGVKTTNGSILSLIHI